MFTVHTLYILQCLTTFNNAIFQLSTYLTYYIPRKIFKNMSTCDSKHLHSIEIKVFLPQKRLSPLTYTKNYKEINILHINSCNSTRIDI